MGNSSPSSPKSARERDLSVDPQLRSRLRPIRGGSLLIAVVDGDLDLAKQCCRQTKRLPFLLLDCDVNGFTPVHLAVLLPNRREFLTQILSVSPSRVGEALNQVDTTFGYSALQCALLTDCTWAVHEMCKFKEAGLHRADHTHHTALHMAAIRGQVTHTKLLLEAGANMYATNNLGRTALHSALQQGQLDSASALLLHGASLEVRDSLGNNPAHTFFEFLLKMCAQTLHGSSSPTVAPSSAKSTHTCTSTSTSTSETPSEPSQGSSYPTVSQPNLPPPSSGDPSSGDPSSPSHVTDVEKEFGEESEHYGLRPFVPDTFRVHSVSRTEVATFVQRLLDSSPSRAWCRWRNKKHQSPPDLLEEVARLDASLVSEELLSRLRAAGCSVDQSTAPGLFRIQICSDLHVEFYDPADPEYDSKLKALFEPAAENLALLGDIGLIRQPSYRAFLLAASEQFRRVFVVLGNHEFYQSTMPGALRNVARICAERENLFLVENASFVVDNVRIVGATLWAHIPEAYVVVVARCMNDYRMIGSEDDNKSGDFDGRDQEALDPTETSAMHAHTVQFIQKELLAARKAGQQVLVLTHHAPLNLNSYGATRPDEWHRRMFLANGSDLSALFQPPLHTWAYGHTHWYHDVTLHGTRVVSNPRGYPNEVLGYDPRMVIEIS